MLLPSNPLKWRELYATSGFHIVEHFINKYTIHRVDQDVPRKSTTAFFFRIYTQKKVYSRSSCSKNHTDLHAFTFILDHYWKTRYSRCLYNCQFMFSSKAKFNYTLRKWIIFSLEFQEDDRQISNTFRMLKLDLTRILFKF